MQRDLGRQLKKFRKNPGCPSDYPILRTRVESMYLKTPIGLAAGFDKQMRYSHLLPHAGFGFAEVGSITAFEKAGNPSPVVVIPEQAGALLNSVGLRNGGVCKTVERVRHTICFSIPMGMSLAPNRTAGSVLMDIPFCASLVERHVDYICLNFSCPNVREGRCWLENDLLKKVVAATRRQMHRSRSTVLLVKISPRLSADEIRATVRAVAEGGGSGIVAGNSREVERACEIVDGRPVFKTWGLSGRPLLDGTVGLVSAVRRAAVEIGVPGMIVVGCGGVASGQDAFRVIRAGANLVQMMTAFLLKGPEVVRESVEELAEALAEAGFLEVGEAVGDGKMS